MDSRKLRSPIFLIFAVLLCLSPSAISALETPELDYVLFDSMRVRFYINVAVSNPAKVAVQWNELEFTADPGQYKVARPANHIETNSPSDRMMTLIGLPPSTNIYVRICTFSTVSSAWSNGPSARVMTKAMNNNIQVKSVSVSHTGRQGSNAMTDSDFSAVISGNRNFVTGPLGSFESDTLYGPEVPYLFVKVELSAPFSVAVNFDQHRLDTPHPSLELPYTNVYSKRFFPTTGPTISGTLMVMFDVRAQNSSVVTTYSIKYKVVPAATSAMLLGPSSIQTIIAKNVNNEARSSTLKFEALLWDDVNFHLSGSSFKPEHGHPIDLNTIFFWTANDVDFPVLFQPENNVNFTSHQIVPMADLANATIFNLIIKPTNWNSNMENQCVEIGMGFYVVDPSTGVLSLATAATCVHIFKDICSSRPHGVRTSWPNWSTLRDVPPPFDNFPQNPLYAEL